MKSPIIVIADDLTGAAEIAGIGLRYGLKVEIVTTLNLESKADLIVISANTRSLSELEARAKTQKIAEKIATIQPSFIFKKIDSVLRGHILAEIEEILVKIAFQNTLIIPINPSLGRTIENGEYFVKGVLITETSFANDPEFAIQNAHVLKMIRAKEGEVKVLKTTENVPTKGIFIGEASSTQDVGYWAFQANQSTLMVGAADFFNAILAKKYSRERRENSPLLPNPQNTKTLYISGTTYQKSVDAIKAKFLRNEAVSYLPIQFFIENSEDFALQKWAEEILFLFEKNPTVIIAIGEISNFQVSPNQLAKWMSLVVQKCSEKLMINQFLIEGGATAAEILSVLAYKSFIPSKEFSQGVISMKPVENHNLNITIKPGSYEWPSEIWTF